MTRETSFTSQLFDSIYLHNLPNNAHGEFTHDVATRARATQAIVTNLAGPLAALEAAVEGETQATYKDLTDSITKEINEILAPRRDSVETALKSGFRAGMEADDQQVATACSTLFELAHLHRLHTDMKIDAQTDAIRDFCSDVEANHAAALQQSGCQALFNKLKAANDAVCDAMMRRMDIEAGRVTGAMVEARRVTDEAYRGLLRGVDAFAYVQGAEDYLPFATFVNQLIKHYKRIYTQAGNGSSSGGTTGGEGAGEEGPTGGGEPTNPSEPSNPQPGEGEGGNNPTVPGGSVAGGNGSNETPTDPTKILLLFNDGAHGNVIVKRMEVEPGYQLTASDLPEGYVYAFKADDQADIDAASPGDTVWVTLSPRS